MKQTTQGKRRAWFAGILLVCGNLLVAGVGYLVARLTHSGDGPIDLAVTRAGGEAPPFYDLIFDAEAVEGMHEALLPDPVTGRRPRPLYRATPTAGPHDVLGFRNLAVPDQADVIVFGDSQTYGWGVPFEATWPRQLELASGRSVYSMALGGWAGAQYRYLFDKALQLRPQQVLVALYMGNDSIDTLRQVYTVDVFAPYRIDGVRSLDELDLKLPRSEAVEVRFGDEAIAFTPAVRWFVNDRSRDAVRVGYRLLAELSSSLAAAAEAAGVKVAFLIVPTKETVFAPRAARDGVVLPQQFRDVVEAEAVNAAELIAALHATGHVVVDATEPLQRAVLDGVRAYPLDKDGHPNGDGYRVIAECAAAALRRSR
ncbi:MAG: hypothetical protein R3F29_09965 [Planctomycetota bacterium]